MDQRAETHHFTLFIDGASRNNPGPSAAGIYLLRDAQVIYKQGCYLGIKTNNQAEYMAFLLGLFFVADYYQPGDTVRVVSDSQLMVRQLRGEYKVRDAALKQLYTIALALARIYNAKIEHVLRADNSNADAMANHGLDNKIPLPDSFVELLRKHGVTV
jgi:ribonuclease HI